MILDEKGKWLNEQLFPLVFLFIVFLMKQRIFYKVSFQLGVGFMFGVVIALSIVSLMAKLINFLETILLG